MRPVIALFAYIIIVFGGAALLAPWLYHAVQSLAETFPSLAKLAANPFHRYVNRCLLFLALAGLYPLIKCLGLKWADLGLTGTKSKAKPWFIGFGIGFVSLALLVVLTIFAGVRKINVHPSAHEWVRHFFSTLATALVVSVLEEVLFRGAILSAMRKAVRTGAALFISSAVYAIVHFFSKPESPKVIEWDSGFIILGRMLKGFGDFNQVMPGFLNLTLAGMILGMVFLRSGNLWWSMGIHAGWIFWLKTYNFATSNAVPPNWFWGTSKLIDGWAAFPILVLTGFIAWRAVKKGPSP